MHDHLIVLTFPARESQGVGAGGGRVPPSSIEPIPRCLIPINAIVSQAYGLVPRIDDDRDFSSKGGTIDLQDRDLDRGPKGYTEGVAAGPEAGEDRGVGASQGAAGIELPPGEGGIS